MPTISVRTKAGRVARTSPHGPYIPNDKYVTVDATPYVMRLLDHHGDIELEPKVKVATKVEAAATKVETVEAAPTVSAIAEKK